MTEVLVDPGPLCGIIFHPMIKDNLFEIKERVGQACKRAGREPDSVTVVGITKERAIEEVQEAIACGITDIGENKVQEAIRKLRDLRATSYELRAKLHLVGHLQSNKAKDAVRIFDLIHSVDSFHLLEEINKQAGNLNKVQDVLIQVNTSGEESKFGLKPQEAIDLILAARVLKNISIKGLMTIAPFVDDPEKVRLYFRSLRELRDKIRDYRLSTIDYQWA